MDVDTTNTLKSYLPKNLFSKINNIFMTVVPSCKYSYLLHSKLNFQHHPKRQVNTSNTIHFSSKTSILINMDVVMSFFLQDELWVLLLDFPSHAVGIFSEVSPSFVITCYEG